MLMVPSALPTFRTQSYFDRQLIGLFSWCNDSVPTPPIYSFRAIYSFRVIYGFRAPPPGPRTHDNSGHTTNSAFLSAFGRTTNSAFGHTTNLVFGPTTNLAIGPTTKLVLGPTTKLKNGLRINVRTYDKYTTYRYIFSPDYHISTPLDTRPRLKHIDITLLPRAPANIPSEVAHPGHYSQYKHNTFYTCYLCLLHLLPTTLGRPAITTKHQINETGITDNYDNHVTLSERASLINQICSFTFNYVERAPEPVNAAIRRAVDNLKNNHE